MNGMLSKDAGDTRPKSQNKDLDKVLKEVWGQGARMRVTKMGIFIYPVDRDRDAILVHHTSSDHHAAENTRKLLAKGGFDV